MNIKSILLFLLTFGMLTACGTASSSSITTNTDEEFTLAVGQAARINDVDLTVTFDSVLSDERCPSEVECAASGPVSISLSVQQDNGAPAAITLETFTDQNGRAPGGEFEGISDRVEVGKYVIQLLGVTPYPKDLSTSIEGAKYQAILIVRENDAASPTN